MCVLFFVVPCSALAAELKGRDEKVNEYFEKDGTQMEDIDFAGDVVSPSLVWVQLFPIPLAFHWTRSHVAHALSYPCRECLQELSVVFLSSLRVCVCAIHSSHACWHRCVDEDA